MSKKYFYVLFLLFIFQLTGCATNTGAYQMTFQDPMNQKPKNAALVQGIAVDQVTGGHETNPMWISKINNENFKLALEQSLQQANLYHQFSGARYILNATLVKLHQPLIGFDFTVDCEIYYLLKNAVTNKIVYSKNIITSYTAKVSDSFIAANRLKMATEGAARMNIGKLIADLYQLSPVMQ